MLTLFIDVPNLTPYSTSSLRLRWFQESFLCIATIKVICFLSEFNHDFTTVHHWCLIPTVWIKNPQGSPNPNQASFCSCRSSSWTSMLHTCSMLPWTISDLGFLDLLWPTLDTLRNSTPYMFGATLTLLRAGIAEGLRIFEMPCRRTFNM